jgi:hypothetical protein
LFLRADRNLVKTVPHPPHRIGTRAGSDETVSGAQVSGGNVAASGDVDAVVGSAADDAACGGADFNDLSSGDRARGLDLPPLRTPAAVVPRQDERERFRLYQVGGAHHPIRGNNTGIARYAVQRAAG